MSRRQAKNDELLFNDDNGPVGSSEKLLCIKYDRKSKNRIFPYKSTPHTQCRFECFSIVILYRDSFDIIECVFSASLSGKKRNDLQK